MTVPDPTQLAFLDGENLTRVESWATFLIELGWRVGDLNQENQPLVTVLILPTRRYAAAFFIAGLVARRAAERPSQEKAEERFLQLASLIEEEPVAATYVRRDGTARMRGILEGVDLDRQRLLFRITNSGRGGSAAMEITPRGSLRVELLDRDLSRLPINQHGQSLEQADELLEHFLPDRNPANFRVERGLDCALIAQKSTVKDDVCDTYFFVGDRDTAEGYELQHVLRIDDFVTRGGSRVQIFSNMSAREPELTGVNLPHAVVYDGGRGYSKWSRWLPGVHRVVLLGRADPDLEPALDAVMKEALTRTGTDDSALAVLPELPAGVEALVFWTR